MISFSKIWQVKDGKLERFQQWMNELDGLRKDEALATFEYEGIEREVFVKFMGTNGSVYVIAFTEGPGIPIDSDKTQQINQEHQALKRECLEPISEPGQLLLELRLNQISDI